ncbi:type I polyketide synthase [Aspergillus mulundensis]|uniref:Ketosynthase family 3 (KS3) domain-containing protein n=1 Tax=Aspergillus mulundensis TaxID=1810919 RepID=A0A3D8R4U3_9EURO|nr:hypothetical protein DSM5745_08711 [Aspergillus mulundensis]RDW68951.1 hypothetical protein DSM5745_08711 [Aspergillus mulundensis]
MLPSTSREGDPARNADPIDEDLSILDNDASMPIAVVGMGFRGPGDATNIEKLWAIMREGRKAFGVLPKREKPSSYESKGAERGHFLQEDISLFDAPSFDLNSDEAAMLHPQERLLLEVTYEALENAGIALAALSRTRASCFVASSNCSSTPREPSAGQSESSIARRVSENFHFEGLSVTLDTPCSDSLVALHLACQSLRSSESAMAIVAGVNIISSPDRLDTASDTPALLPNGRTLSQNAGGCEMGEGIGCLILKPLKNAVHDNDPIRAIIRGSGIHSGGSTEPTRVFNGRAHNALIQSVYDTAGLVAQSTEFIEIHGLEAKTDYSKTVAACTSRFGLRHPQDPLRLGSLQANIGHLGGASGVASVIKTALMLEQQMFLPSGDLSGLLGEAMDEEWNVKLPVECEPWDTRGPHRASVINLSPQNTAHVILEDAAGYLAQRHLAIVESRIPQERGSRARIFLISAMDEQSLRSRIQSLQIYLQGNADDSSDEWMNNLAFTLSERRTAHLYRTVVISESVTKLRTRLASRVKILNANKTPVVGFVFTGQGAQWPGMGKELLDSHPVFRQSMQRVNSYMSRLGAPYNIIDEILKNKDTSNLDDPLLSQPICSALQIALVDLLAAWGIHPDAVTGHSSGEIAAAYAAGMLTMEDAITIAYYRGVLGSALSKRQARGAMTAVGLSASDAEPYVAALKTGKATIGCINSPTSVTVSGDAPGIEELEIVLEAKGVFVRRLDVDVAYHSHHMDLVAREYLDAMAGIIPVTVDGHGRRVQFFSSVTGCEIFSADLGPQYWLDNLADQVRMVDAIQALCFGTKSHDSNAQSNSSVAVDSLVEIGPHAALAGPIRQILKASCDLDKANIEYTSVLIKGMDGTSSALTVAAALVVKGLPVNFQAVNRPDAIYKPQVLVDLPPYNWNHATSYGMGPPKSDAVQTRLYRSQDTIGKSSTSYPGPEFSTNGPDNRTVYKVVWKPAEETLSQIPPGTSPIVARKSRHPAAANSSTVQIIREDGDSGVCIPHLQNLLESCNCTVGVSDIQRTRDEDIAGKFCIVLSELKYSILGLLEDSTLRTIKRMLQTAAGVLWVTRGGTGNPTYPESSLINGFARSVRSASCTKLFVTLDLNGEGFLYPQQAAEAIYDLFYGRILHPPSTVCRESEYAERQGVLHVPRVVQDLRSIERLASISDAQEKGDSDSLFRADASYMVVDAVGKLGIAVAVWMVEKGARNIILVTHYGITDAVSKDTIEVRKSKDVNFVSKTVDISDADSVAALAADLADTAPPIRGVIHVATAVKHVPFHEMTTADYHAVFQPMYHGTWNLHRHLPRDLNFFIMVSSVSHMLSTATHAAYSAASSLMDSFAAYRNRAGLHAVSIHLGQNAENNIEQTAEGSAELRTHISESTDTEALMSFLELAITSQPQSDINHSSQLIAGIGGWKEGTSLSDLGTSLVASPRRDI